MIKKSLYKNKEWLHYQYVKLGKLQSQISEEFGFSQSTLSRWMKKLNVHTRKIVGENHPNWRGGIYDKNKDYSKIKINGNYKFEHNIIVENIIERSLTSGEVVHHIDHNKANDSPDNLFLCESRGIHQSIHQQFRYFAKELAKKLYKLKLIEFHKENAIYNLNEKKIRQLNIFTEEEISDLINSLYVDQLKLEKIFKRREEIIENAKRREKEREEYEKSEEFKIENGKVIDIMREFSNRIFK